MGWRGTSLLSAYGRDLILKEQVSGSFPVDVSKHKSNRFISQKIRKAGVKQPNKYLILCPFQCHDNLKKQIIDHPLG